MSGIWIDELHSFKRRILTDIKLLQEHGFVVNILKHSGEFMVQHSNTVFHLKIIVSTYTAPIHSSSHLLYPFIPPTITPEMTTSKEWYATIPLYQWMFLLMKEHADESDEENVEGINDEYYEETVR